MQALMVTVMSLLLYSNVSIPLVSFAPLLYVTIRFFFLGILGDVKGDSFCCLLNNSH